MNKQEQFDIIVNHLLEQNERSGKLEGYNAASTCYYRHPDDKRKCAVGILIPDDQYDPKMEGKGVGLLLREYPQLESFIDTGLWVNDCQIIHDRSSISDWPAHLRIVAKEYELQYNGVK